MDVQYPYAEGLSRRQLLYRLPGAPAPRRLLVVHTGANEAALLGGGWGAPVSVVASCELQALAAHGGERFDAVALPAVLSAGQGTAGADVLTLARGLLVPGGVAIGHLEHGCALRRWASLAGLRAVAGALLGTQGLGSPSQCQRALRRAGFSEPACFFVQPNIDEPMGLIPSDIVAARAHFLRSVRSSRHHYGRLGYALRLALTRAGLGGTLQPQLFFWARRPC